MMHSLLVVLGLLLASPLAYSQQADPSVGPLLNGDFENCPIGLTPPGWTQAGSQPLTTLCSQNFVHAGNFSARFFPGDFPNGYFAAISQNVPIVEAGQTFVISYWVRVGDEPTPRPVDGINTTLVVDGATLSPISTIISPPDATSFSLVQQTFIAPNAGSITGVLNIAFMARSFLNIYVDDINIFAPPVIVGDPQFVGLCGQSYQVHGVDGEIYNLVSSNNSQVNARFVFLSAGQCPVVDGVVQRGDCWSHPGSYLGEIGILQRVDDHVNKVTIESGEADYGFKSVVVNDNKLDVSSSVNDTASFSITYESTHRVVVQTEEFTYMFTNSDMFINQAVIPNVPLSKLTTHGMFGQTHKCAIYPTKLKYIEGDVDDYVIEDQDLFGSGFVYNKFDKSL